MTISTRVKEQFFASTSPVSERLIRLPPTVVTQYAKENSGQVPVAAPKRRLAMTRRRRTNLWTVEEHERFLEGLERFPLGPWKEISALVGTKTTRQTMTHAQKYRQKIERRLRIGNLDVDAMEASTRLNGKRVEAAEPACNALSVGGSPLTAEAFADPAIFDDRAFFTSLLAEIEPQFKLQPVALFTPYEDFYSF